MSSSKGDSIPASFCKECHFSKGVQYLIFSPKEIKHFFFSPRRSSISFFPQGDQVPFSLVYTILFQGGKVYHPCPQGGERSPLFSKEGQYIMLVQGDQDSPFLNPRQHIVTDIHQASGFWAQNPLTIQRCFQKGKQILAMSLRTRD